MLKINIVYICLLVFLIGILIGLCFLIPSIEHPWEIVELENTKCLDGSNYKFLFHKGSVNKFLIFFQEGGLCGTNGEFFKSCEERTQTNLGSSKYFDFFAINVFSKYSRFFSSKESYNPLFHNWNRVYLKYCDGMIYTGLGNEPITTPSGYKLYFNGESNVLGTIDYLINNHALKTAENVVITGASAGGAAATMWGNYILNSLSPTINGLIINDSGFIVNFKNTKEHEIFKGFIQTMIKNTQFEQYIEKSKVLADICPDKKTIDTVWECYFADTFIDKVKFPLLLLESSYDSWIIAMLGELKCFTESIDMYHNCDSKEQESMMNYASFFNKKIKEIQLIKNDFSLWSPSSLTHTFLSLSDAWDSKAWYIDDLNKSMTQVIGDWMKKPTESFVYFDKTIEKITKQSLKDRIWYLMYFSM